MTHVTCRLTANNWDQLRNPTFGNRVWATFTFYPKGYIATAGCTNVFVCMLSIWLCVGPCSVPIGLTQWLHWESRLRGIATAGARMCLCVSWLRCIAMAGCTDVFVCVLAKVYSHGWVYRCVCVCRCVQHSCQLISSGVGSVTTLSVPAWRVERESSTTRRYSAATKRCGFVIHTTLLPFIGQFLPGGLRSAAFTLT